MTLISRCLGCTGLAAIAMAIVAQPASAQDVAAASQAESAPDEVPSGDIVVTAQKRSERLSEVPMSITVLSTSDLASRGQTRIQDYLAQVPGLSAYSGTAGQTTLAIRGITTGGHNNPTVGITVDDIPLGSSIRGTYGDQLAPELDPAILQQIEVLRGPQGTLYGAASLGGLIRYVTTTPQFDQWSGRAEINGSAVAHGSQGFAARGAVNVPIASTLAASFSGFFRRDPGYVDDASRGLGNLDRADTYGGRAALYWTPADIVKVKLAALFNRIDGNGVSDVDGNANLKPIRDFNQTRIAGSGAYRTRLQFYTANIDVDLGAATFTSATGYTRNNYEYVRDYDPTRGATLRGIYGANVGATVNFRAPSWKVSQEFRLTGVTGHPLEWQIGFFYNHEVGSPHFDTVTTSLATGKYLNTYTYDNFPIRFSEYAGFANLVYHFSDRFDVQGGFRYSWNEQNFHESITGYPYIGKAPYFVQVTSKDEARTYSVSPRFRVTRDLMVYGRVSTGYRPGGPNSGAGIGYPSQYGADTTTNYEAGVKSSFFNKALTFDAALYWINWDKIQLQLRDPATNFIFYTNAGRARSRGVEVSAAVKPGHGLSITGALGFSDATLREDLPTAPGNPKRGDRLPFSAKWTGSVVADETFPIGAAATGFVGGTYNYVGARSNGYTAVGTKIMPAYQTVDLRVGVTTGGVKLTAYVQNVGDNFGILAADARNNSLASPFSQIYAMTLIRPRTFGVSISKAF